MSKRINSIAPLQLGKVLGISYGLMALLLVPIFLVFAAVPAIASKAHGGGGPPVFVLLGMGLALIVFAPVLYAVIGFLTGVVGAFIYNLVARWVGGIEVEVQ